jgi:hypothetical protein
MGALIDLVMELVQSTLDVYGTLREMAERWKRWRARRAEKRKKREPPS